MGVQIVYEVRQRSAADPFLSRELGLFTDDMMAEQVIWACYRESWKVMLSSEFLPDEWFTSELREIVATQGYDTWSVNDDNSAAPLFYKVKHKLWNQVPSSLTGFQFSLVGSTLI